MRELIKIYTDRCSAEREINTALDYGYYLVDFKMKLSHGSYGGDYNKAPEFQERYFVHMRKVDSSEQVFHNTVKQSYKIKE